MFFESYRRTYILNNETICNLGIEHGDPIESFTLCIIYRKNINKGYSKHAFFSPSLYVFQLIKKFENTKYFCNCFLYTNKL